MNDSNCLTRDYIKREIFPIIHKELNDFLDHEKINKEGNELILPLKEKIDKESLQTKSVELRKILKNFIEQNTEIQNIVKKNFAKRLGLSENEIEYIAPGTFTGLPRLESLYLNSNQLRILNLLFAFPSAST